MAGRFGLRDGRADLVERMPASGRGFENSVADQAGDRIHQLAARLCCEPGQPVTEPENFQNTPTGQDVAWIVANADRSPVSEP